MDQRLCCNPSCSNPVRSDPRWNDQYCSTECVRDHCNLVFSKWLTGKRPNERNPHPCPSTNPADPVVERPVPTNLTPVPFIKQEPHESVPDDLAGRNTSSPAHFPNEASESVSTFRVDHEKRKQIMSCACTIAISFLSVFIFCNFTVQSSSFVGQCHCIHPSPKI